MYWKRESYFPQSIRNAKESSWFISVMSKPGRVSFSHFCPFDFKIYTQVCFYNVILGQAMTFWSHLKPVCCLTLSMAQSQGIEESGEVSKKTFLLSLIPSGLDQAVKGTLVSGLWDNGGASLGQQFLCALRTCQGLPSSMLCIPLQL
jgi:hypothetical protein